MVNSRRDMVVAVAVAMIGTTAVDRVAHHEMEIPLFARMVDGRNPKSVITPRQETDDGRRADEEEAEIVMNYIL